MNEGINKFDIYKPPENPLLNIEARTALENLQQELQKLCTQLSSPDISRTQEIATGQQIVSIQKEQLPKIYRDVSLETPYLATHNIQNERYSCQLASASNILKGLGLDVTENEVAKAIGKTGEAEGNVWQHELSKYLETLGLEVKRVMNALEVIESLIAGGKIVLPLLPPKYPYPHTVIISGIKIDHGNIEFYINDPQYKNYAETIPLGVVVENTVPYSYYAITPVFAVSKKSADKELA